MSAQHQKWINLVKSKMDEKNWTQRDLAIVVGVSDPMISKVLKEGKGSDDLKLRINKKLGIKESWEKFEEA